jgi:hypothetical protein
MSIRLRTHYPKIPNYPHLDQCNSISQRRANYAYMISIRALVHVKDKKTKYDAEHYNLLTDPTTCLQTPLQSFRQALPMPPARPQSSKCAWLMFNCLWSLLLSCRASRCRSANCLNCRCPYHCRRLVITLGMRCSWWVWVRWTECSTEEGV